MKKTLFSLVLFLVFFISKGQSDNDFDKTLMSPDANYEINVSQKWDDSGKSIITYSVNFKGKQVILNSQFNIQLDNHLHEWALAIKDTPKGDWMDELVLKDVKVNSVANTWKPIFGERNTIENNYNELVLSFEQKSSSNYKMDIQIRAYNQGVAFRYYFHTNPSGIYYHITEENTEFTFPENTKAWFEPWAQGTYELLPLNNWPTESERPLTLELENGLYACIAEAGLVDFVRTKFELSNVKANTINLVENNLSIL
mgnify:CR=1 FL=1